MTSQTRSGTGPELSVILVSLGLAHRDETYISRKRLQLPHEQIILAPRIGPIDTVHGDCGVEARIRYFVSESTGRNTSLQLNRLVLTVRDTHFLFREPRDSVLDVLQWRKNR